MPILVATDREVVIIDIERGASAPARGIGGRPTCLAVDALVHGRAWCGTHKGGVFRSDDGGRSWQPVGLADRLIMAVTASPVERDTIWAGTEPSEVWRSGDAGNTWEQTSRLETLPSSSRWSFPPRPDTHHVRWIACHPLEPDRLWVAIEAGALVSTIDRGRTWRDRVPGGPRDTHELAIHRKAPDTLRVAAGDGYFESDDAGMTWRSRQPAKRPGGIRDSEFEFRPTPCILTRRYVLQSRVPVRIPRPAQAGNRRSEPAVLNDAYVLQLEGVGGQVIDCLNRSA